MIKREASIFLVVGSLTVLVDFLTYTGLTSLGGSTELSKGISFLIGTVFAYVANKLWTFGHKEHEYGSLWRFVLLYGCTLSVNVIANMVCLWLFQSLFFSLELSFVIATGLSAVLNFLGMKFFVFNQRVCQELQ